MAGCDQWAILKVFEVLLCVCCLLYKWWTDEEASRLFFFLEKNSQEWPLVNNITWNQAGSWIADITYGGYVIITIGLLLAHVLGESQYTRRTESFLLGIGALLFFGVGCMVITSFDNVPDRLVANAIILGLLSILTGFLFLVDIGCFKRRERDKTSRRDKEFRMSGRKETADDVVRVAPPPAALHQQVTITEKSQPTLQNGVAKTEVRRDEVISELRSSMKQKTEKSPADRQPPDPSRHHRTENEKVQTKESQQIAQRRYSNSRGVPKGRQQPAVDQHDNGYDYDQQSIRNYDGGDSAGDTDHSKDDDHDDDDIDEPYRYERRSRGSQTSRKHYQKTVERVIVRDAETSTDAPTVVKTTTTVHYRIQSPTVSTTDPHKSDSPATSEEAYELQPPASSSYLLSNGKKFQPVITASRIDRLARNGHTLDKDMQHSATSSSVPVPAPLPLPSSPQDPGYVLHTASKWPNTTPLAPQPFRKLKEHETALRPVQSAV